MLWSSVRTWAKNQGYYTNRIKIENEEDTQYQYDWYKLDDPSIKGQTTSASKLATAIYNNITNNKYLEYQTQYKLNQTNKDVDHNEFK
jgi:hypothetical protein